MTDVVSIIRNDHFFLLLTSPRIYFWGVEYIINESIREMLKYLHKNVSSLNLWIEMKEENFNIKLIQKNIKYKI